MNMNEIKVVENTNFYDKMADYVEFAVSSSYGEDGRYHQYRNDFAKAVAIISMCTNYDSNDFTFKDVPRRPSHPRPRVCPAHRPRVSPSH